jgi:ribose 5-phosphate isomerase
MQNNNDCSDSDETLSVSTDATTHSPSISQQDWKDVFDMVKQATENTKQLERMLLIITSVVEHGKSC